MEEETTGMTTTPECTVEICYDRNMSTWIIDQERGIATEWGNLTSGWKHMTQEELEEGFTLLDSLRQATDEEITSLFKGLGYE